MKVDEISAISTLDFRKAKEGFQERRKDANAKAKECFARGLALAGELLLRAARNASDAELCKDNLFQEARVEILDYKIQNNGVDSSKVKFAEQAYEWVMNTRRTA